MTLTIPRCSKTTFTDRIALSILTYSRNLRMRQDVIFPDCQEGKVVWLSKRRRWGMSNSKDRAQNFKKVKDSKLKRVKTMMMDDFYYLFRNRSTVSTIDTRGGTQKACALWRSKIWIFSFFLTCAHKAPDKYHPRDSWVLWNMNKKHSCALSCALFWAFIRRRIRRRNLKKLFLAPLAMRT